MYTIGVNFDGACVQIPDVGVDIGAARVLKLIADAGHSIVCLTSRPGNCASLADAVEWFDSNGVPIVGINRNPNQPCGINISMTYCDIRIDVHAVGAPLTSDAENISRGGSPYIDWRIVESTLRRMGVLDPEGVNWPQSVIRDISLR